VRAVDNAGCVCVCVHGPWSHSHVFLLQGIGCRHSLWSSRESSSRKKTFAWYVVSVHLNCPLSLSTLAVHT
jgi:hypothetical protein